jgi:hypothetical protein
VNRKPVQLIRAVLGAAALTCAIPAGAQDARSFGGAFSADRALALVYGGPVWNSPELSRYPSFTEQRAFIEPLFEAAYVEGGVEKHIVIATLTPQPRREYSCHACGPLLGGAVYRAEGSSWTLEAAGPIIEFGHAWYGSNSWLELVRIGADRHGLLHRIEDMGGGYEDKSASLIFASGGELAVQFAAPPVSGPGPGACGIPEEQHLLVTIDAPDAPASEIALFDVIVDARWNDARCGSLEGGVMTFSGQVCQRVSRYRSADGVYALVATERDECVPLPEGVRISPRG